MATISKATQISWRRFLSSDAGMEGMMYLRDTAPTIQKGQPHEICFDAGVATGWGKVIDKIYESVANPPQPEQNLENA